MAKLRIHKKDSVVVLSGRDRGKQGEVLKVFPGTNGGPERVLVGKINIVTSYAKRQGAEPGGIQKSEAPLPASKVMLLCPKCRKPIRPKLDRLKDGKPVRLCRKCGEVIL